MSPRVFLIVLCYNDIASTLACLDSLLAQDYPFSEILVVDNASQDGTVPTVRKSFPKIDVIATGENLGYTGGNNLGMQVALRRGAEALFLVNNDTVLERSCVSTLVGLLASHPQVGVVGPMVYSGSTPTVISSAGGQIDWRGADAFNVGAGQPDEQQYPARAVDYINGCGILVTSAAVRGIGLLDPRYFMYWEETDWCQRAHRAGFQVRFEPAARMVHKGTISVTDLGPTTLYYVTRNRFRFFASHTSAAQKPVALVRALHGVVQGIAQHQQAGRLAHAQATRLALWHALIGRWGRYNGAFSGTRAAAGEAHRSHPCGGVS